MNLKELTFTFTCGHSETWAYLGNIWRRTKYLSDEPNHTTTCKNKVFGTNLLPAPRTIEGNEMKKVIVLIGLPGSGKSTLAQELDLPVINRDQIRYKGSKPYEFTKENEQKVRQTRNELIEYYGLTNDSFIIDECNLSESHRAKVLDLIPNSIRKTYHLEVYFCTESINNLKHRMTDPRGQSEEKWKEVIESMKDSLETPTYEEFQGLGFISTKIFFYPISD